MSTRVLCARALGAGPHLGPSPDPGPGPGSGMARSSVATCIAACLAATVVAIACCCACFAAPEATQLGPTAAQPMLPTPPILLAMEDAMRLAESSSPAVTAARRALELARLELQAAIGEQRPSVVLRITPIRAESGFPVASSVDGQMRIPLPIPLRGGYLSLSSSMSLRFEELGPQGEGGWGASLSVPILGPQKEVADSIESAESQVRKAQSRLKEAVRQARASAQVAYFSALAAQDRVVAADQALARIQEHAVFVESRYAVGNAGELDVLEATASIARAQATAESARHGLAVARMNLNQAIGAELRATEHVAPAGEYVVWPAEMDLDACVQAALGARPEIAAAKQDVSDAEKALQRAVAAKRPGALLQAQISSGGKWSVGLELSAMLTPNHSADIAVASAQDRVEQVRADVERTRNSIMLEVVEAYYGLHDAEVAVGLAQSAVEIALAMLKIKEEQCRIGAVPYTEVSEAIETARKAETDLASAVAACFIAQPKLLAAISPPAWVVEPRVGAKAGP